MNDGSGPTWREPFATYDRDSCSWRTSRPSLFEDCLRASPPTWPDSGTWDLGAAYEHPMSAPATSEGGSSSSPGLLFPTPAARDWKSGASNIMDRNARPLNEVVQNWLLPTPLASDGGLDRGSSAGYGLRNVTREIARAQLGQPTPSGAAPEPSAATRQPSAATSGPSDDGLLPLWSLEETENPA
jgi:hypothetical protein